MIVAFAYFNFGSRGLNWKGAIDLTKFTGKSKGWVGLVDNSRNKRLHGIIHRVAGFEE